MGCLKLQRHGVNLTAANLVLIRMGKPTSRCVYAYIVNVVCIHHCSVLVHLARALSIINYNQPFNPPGFARVPYEII